MPADEVQFDRAIGRMRACMLLLSLAGAGLGWRLRGWPWGLGFLAGAAASLANFHWLHQLTVSLGPGGRRLRRRIVGLLALRYLLLGLCGYVIVRFFGLSLTAAVVGLFVAVGAVLFEILYELLTYARA
jgi:hypothetical protein